MNVVAAYIYRDGRRDRPVSLEGAAATPLAEGEFVWIGLVDPQEEDIRGLQERFGLHPLAVEDALKAHQLPKVDLYGEQLFVVARTAHLEAGRIVFGETSVFVGPDHIITVRHGSTRSHTELRERLESTPAMLRHGVDYVLHAVLDYVVDGYVPVIEGLEEEILQMEKAALTHFLTREEVQRIFRMRRDLMRFRRMLGPMEEVARRLEHFETPCIDPEVRLYFRDVHDHVRHVSSVVDGLREVLSTVFEVSTLLEQQRQSDITRKLAAWAAILAVPTAVAGLYGMNFDVMPELHWKFGYFAVVGLIAGVSIYLHHRFRRSGWL